MAKPQCQVCVFRIQCLITPFCLMETLGHGRFLRFVDTWIRLSINQDTPANAVVGQLVRVFWQLRNQLSAVPDYRRVYNFLMHLSKDGRVRVERRGGNLWVIV